jgi:polysaccharide biosynthesis protein PelA
MTLSLTRRQASSFLAAGGMTMITGRGAASSSQLIRPDASWVVYYSAVANATRLSGFNVIVLDPAYSGAIADCRSHGGRTFGYLSLGEISKRNAWFPFPSDPAAILEENPDWPGTYRVDVRQESWRAAILNDGVKRLREMGFDGLFMDTLDTPPYLEAIDPRRCRGMGAAAIDLVKSIRRQWPDMPIIMNRGYALLAELVDDIDAIVAESLLTTYDSATGAYRWVEPDHVAEQIKLLSPANRRSPQLPILSLDYWKPDEPETIREIYRRERGLGHSPYVGTINLDQIVDAPLT